MPEGINPEGSWLVRHANQCGRGHLRQIGTHFRDGDQSTARPIPHRTLVMFVTRLEKHLGVHQHNCLRVGRAKPDEHIGEGRSHLVMERIVFKPGRVGHRHVAKETERGIGPECQRRATGGKGILPQQILAEVNPDGFEGRSDFHRWLGGHFFTAQNPNRPGYFITFRPELLLNSADQVFTSLPAKHLQIVGRERMVNVARPFKPRRHNLHLPVICGMRHEPFVHRPKRRLATGNQPGQHQQTDGTARTLQNYFYQAVHGKKVIPSSPWHTVYRP